MDMYNDTNTFLFQNKLFFKLSIHQSILRKKSSQKYEAAQLVLNINNTQKCFLSSKSAY